MMASVYRFLLSPGRIDTHTARCARAQGRHSALAIHIAPRDSSVQVASVFLLVALINLKW